MSTFLFVAQTYRMNYSSPSFRFPSGFKKTKPIFAFLLTRLLLQHDFCFYKQLPAFILLSLLFVPFGKNPKLQENILLLQWRFCVHATQFCTGQQTVQDNIIRSKGQCKKRKMGERLQPKKPYKPLRKHPKIFFFINMLSLFKCHR